jgi:molybdenum cofactor biosynthesis enzyme MoaA
MPSEGVELSPQGKILTNDEVIRLAKLFVQSGVTKIRLTGGEPTIRKGIGEIISKYLVLDASEERQRSSRDRSFERIKRAWPEVDRDDHQWYRTPSPSAPVHREWPFTY